MRTITFLLEAEEEMNFSVSCDFYHIIVNYIFPLYFKYKIEYLNE